MELTQIQNATSPATSAGAGWAPQACTLPTAEQPLRLAKFDALFAEAVTGVERAAPGRVRLRLRPGPQIAGRAATLAAAETGCCSFFTFILTATGGALSLEVSVADPHVRCWRRWPTGRPPWSTRRPTRPLRTGRGAGRTSPRQAGRGRGVPLSRSPEAAAG